MTQIKEDSRVIRPGSFGWRVHQLQETWHYWQSPGCECYGVWSDEWVAATKALQKDYDVPQTGAFDLPLQAAIQAAGLDVGALWNETVCGPTLFVTDLETALIEVPDLADVPVRVPHFGWYEKPPQSVCIIPAWNRPTVGATPVDMTKHITNYLAQQHVVLVVGERNASWQAKEWRTRAEHSEPAASIVYQCTATDGVPLHPAILSLLGVYSSAPIYIVADGLR